MNNDDEAGNDLTRRDVLIAGVLAGASCALGGIGRAAAATATATTTATAATSAGAQVAPISTKIPQRIYGNDAYPVWYRRPLPLDTPSARYPGFKPGSTLLKAGTLRRKGAMPLPCDIVFERDVALKLRDGKTLYTDVFRPAIAGRYPVVMAWSPYGKEIGGQWFDDVPGRSGVPLSVVSELQKFEGPDPARFCAKGYVVLNPDARGAYMSDGNINFWGRQVAEDGYDVIEWAAAQPWSSGKVAMAGNSWLAISQWFIAAEKPPHLAAIAPWEGATDHYPRGGIVEIGFAETIVQTFAGRNLVEDLPRMTADYPLRTPYWDDKAARVQNIDVPAYVVASYTHPAHTWGSFHGFRQIASARKWLRVHNTNEWHDFNQDAHQDDLLRFFDHVLKGTDNGWDRTPRVRLTVLNPGGRDIVGRAESSFPLERQSFSPLYLSGDGRLVREAQAAPARLSHAALGGATTFRIAFDRDTEITGYMSLKLWLEAEGANDMDVMVTVEKFGADGRPAAGDPNTTRGGRVAAGGALRVSLRELDPHLSTASEPVLKLEREQPLKPGQIVPVAINIWPMGMLYKAGESLVLTVAGTRPPPDLPWNFGEAKIPVPRDGGTFAPGTEPDVIVLGGPPSSRPAYSSAQTVPELPGKNAGTHILHVGGQYDSHLLVPFIPTGGPQNA